jgi:hypothetical protein
MGPPLVVLAAVVVVVDVDEAAVVVPAAVDEACVAVELAWVDDETVAVVTTPDPPAPPVPPEPSIPVPLAQAAATKIDPKAKMVVAAGSEAKRRILEG